MPVSDTRTIVEDYLQALKEGDLSRCLDFFADDATIYFQAGVFRGKEAIEEWHKERLAVHFQIAQVDRVSVNGHTAVVEGAVTSDRLKAWKINRLAGKAEVLFAGDKIKEVRFKARVYNPLEGW